MFVIKIVKFAFKKGRRLMKSRRFRAIVLYLVKRKLDQQDKIEE